MTISQTFVITGGHHNSALVVARELLKSGHRVEWIGHRFAAKGDRHDSAEYVEVTAAQIPFHNLVAGKTEFSLQNLLNVPLGLIRASQILKRINPDAVISFGGYLGLAVSLAAYLRRIPLFLHEQTVVAGKANQLVALLAKRVYLTWASSLRYYPKVKSIVVGLPLRPSFLEHNQKKVFRGSKPVLLILGGKQGSHVINQLIFANLQNLLLKYNLIHQTGTSSATGDYDQAVALKASLSPALAKSYEPRGYIGEDEIAEYMRSADLFLGRSGAHATYELGVLGKSAVLIPLLLTHGREQLHNARLLVSAGIATILPQSELSYPRLKHAISLALRRAKPKSLDLPTDAAVKLMRDIFQHLP